MDDDKKVAEEQEQPAWWETCAGCDGHGSIEDDDFEQIECPVCLGQGVVCDKCGAAMSHEWRGEWRGGCWCHY